MLLDVVYDFFCEVLYGLLCCFIQSVMQCVSDVLYDVLYDVMYDALYDVVVVVVLVGQTVGSISSKTLANIWQVNSDILGIFCPMFVQAILERVHCSAGYNFIWYGIPGCCDFNRVKVLGN